MAKFYLVYEKRTPAELPLGVFSNVPSLARFIGVTREHAYQIISGKKTNPYYGVYVDEVTDNDIV